MNNKKISIITICYNNPKLEITCESIVSQTWQDFEWIVIDGGSNDETMRIFDKYKYRIDKFISEPDEGIYNAINKGITIANGEYLNFLNSGDSYCNKYVLENIHKKLRGYNNIFVFNSYIIYSKQNTKKQYISYNDFSDKWLVAHNLNHQAMMIHNNLFKKFGLYDETYKIYSDWEKNICFIKNHVKFKFYNDYIVNYDGEGLSASTDINTKNKMEEEKILFLNKYFTQKEIAKAKQMAQKAKNMPRFKTLENIFSIKKTKNKKHKILTILGIHIIFNNYV